MTKRSFDRDGENLRDSAPPGPRGAVELRIPSAAAVNAHAIDRALQRLSHGDVTAPQELIAATPDPRVSAALIEAARVGSTAMLANVAHALGVAKLEAGVMVLQDRLAQLVAAARSSSNRQRGPSMVIVALCSVAEALLVLQSGHEEAASALAVAVSDTDLANRRLAAQAVARVLALPLAQDAREKLVRAGRHLLDDADAEVFGTIAPALIDSDEERILGRCATMLLSDDLRVREAAVLALGRSRSASGRQMLANHTPQEGNLGVACAAVLALGDEAPAVLVGDIAERALASESPYVRWMALGMLRHLPPAKARTIAEAAMSSEPDAFLLMELQRVLASRTT